MVDVLEPRLLYSADSLSGLLPLLIPDEDVQSQQVLSDSMLDELRHEQALADAQEEVAVAADNRASSNLLQSDQLDTSNDAAGVNRIDTIVFVDISVPSSEQLLDAVDDTNTLVVTIDSDEDGLLRITQVLADHEDLNSVQIISHGTAGQIQLGNVTLDESALLTNQAAVQSWSNALAADADMLLLGCDVADGTQGIAFVEQLAQLTGADVAASTDKTGAAELGGDWQLEYKTGSIGSLMAVSEQARNDWQHTLATITVDTAEDQFDIALGTTLEELLVLQSSGETVSLREAVYASSQGPESVDKIILGSANYQLTLSDLDIGSTVGGDLDIFDDLYLVGNGFNTSSIEMTLPNHRVLDIHDSSVSIQRVEISGGRSTAEGGGIRAATGTDLELREVRLTNNVATTDGLSLIHI